MLPLVSVIVPTKNSALYLERCLQSIAQQTYQNLEIIVVDNQSSDATKEIARRFTDKVYDHGPERCSQLNMGAQVATGKYLYRVDSDFVVENDVVQQCVDACEKQGYQAIAVHNSSDPTVSFWSHVRKFERDMYKGDGLIVGARFFLRSMFLELGGFDEALVAGEDYDIHNRLLGAGGLVGRIEAQELHLGEPRSLKEIVDKSYFYGLSIGKYLAKSGKRGMQQMNPIRGSFLRNWSQFVRHPKLSLGLFVMTMAKFGAGGIGLIVAKIRP